ncbi:uncharacterized protein LOC136093394 [Hydra vulgaris]|uniref:uncharacterized protein LOC136093394 n=1 Tax=Hydra vulgaris TaxID=6087 RepID=UPI0032E9C364
MAKPIKSNLDKEQRKALYEIKKDDNIMIRGKTKKLNYDPTPQIIRKVQNILRKLNKAGQFTVKEYKDLYPSDAIPPRLYGVIKAHKLEKNYLMRVIVSTIGTTTYKISKFLTDMIQPILNKNNTHLKNSQQFVNLANSWNIDKDEIQVSYDIINLYPSVPVKEAIIILIERLKNDPSFTSKFTFDEIKTLLDICLLHCYFLFEHDIYELEDSGTSTYELKDSGLGLMVVVAKYFLQFHESNAIVQAISNNIQLKSFKRYVDDSHSRFNSTEDAKKILMLLNNQHKNIQYTMIIENENNTLNFLDVTIINNKTGTYDFKVYRKDALANVQIKPNSCHDPKIINGIFKGFVHRTLYLCSDNNIEQELLFLVDVFVENGYKCSCKKCYVGETKLKISSRIYQHQKNTYEGN